MSLAFVPHTQSRFIRRKMCGCGSLWLSEEGCGCVGVGFCGCLRWSVGVGCVAGYIAAALYIWLAVASVQMVTGYAAFVQVERFLKHFMERL